MNDEQKRKLASELFRLGGLTSKLLFWLENAWFDEDTKEHSAAFGRVAITGSEIAHLVDDLDEKTTPPPGVDNGLASLATAVGKFYTKYREAWLGDDRIQMSQRFKFCDPEFAYDFQLEVLTKNSPLCDPLWESFKTTLTDLPQKMGSAGYHACFALGQMLACMEFPAITSDHGKLSGSQLQAYFGVEFNSDLAKYMAALKEEFQGFQDLDYDLSKFAGSGISQTIIRLRDEIAKRWEKPPITPGYLGLVLDESQGSVRRDGQEAPLRGKLVWTVLRCLEHNGLELTPRETLNTALSKSNAKSSSSLHTTTDYSDESLYQYLKILRAKLKPLGIAIPAERELGWRLMDAKEYNQNHPKQRTKKRRRS